MNLAIHLTAPALTSVQFGAGLPSMASAFIASLLNSPEPEAPAAAPAPDDTGRPAIGEVWPGQGGIYAGDFRAGDGTVYGLIVASEEDVGRARWAQDGERDLSDWDGLANTAALRTDCPAAKLAAASASASDTESVLIDGIAYEVPAAVAGELLSLHLDLLAAAPAQAVAVPEGYALVPVASTAAMEWAFRRAEVTYRDGAGQRQPMDPHSEFQARYRNMLAAIPAQEHATQLAGQGLELADAIRFRNYMTASLDGNEAFMNAIFGSQRCIQTLDDMRAVFDDAARAAQGGAA